MRPRDEKKEWGKAPIAECGEPSFLLELRTSERPDWGLLVFTLELLQGAGGAVGVEAVGDGAGQGEGWLRLRMPSR